MAETFVERPAAELFADANAWILDSLGKVAESGTTDITVDADFHLPDGALASLNLTTVPLIDIAEENIGTMLMLEDMTGEKRVKTTMARYMSKEVADQLLEGGDDALEGKDQKVSILFSDVRNFTAVSEVLGARGTVSIARPPHRGHLPQPRTNPRGLYGAGLGLYRDRQWQEAAAAFERGLGLHAGDRPSEIYLERCAYHAAQPPPADWDGVWVHTEK